MTGLLRYPLLTLSLLIAWLLLAVSLSPGNILLGGVLALVLSGTLMVLALPKARLRRLGTVPHDRVEAWIGEHAHLTSTARDPQYEVVGSVYDVARDGGRLARGIGTPAIGGAAGSEHERQRE